MNKEFIHRDSISKIKCQHCGNWHFVNEGDFLEEQYEVVWCDRKEDMYTELFFDDEGYLGNYSTNEGFGEGVVYIKQEGIDIAVYINIKNADVAGNVFDKNPFALELDILKLKQRIEKTLEENGEEFLKGFGGNENLLQYILREKEEVLEERLLAYQTISQKVEELGKIMETKKINPRVRVELDLRVGFAERQLRLLKKQILELKVQVVDEIKDEIQVLEELLSSKKGIFHTFMIEENIEQRREKLIFFQKECDI